MTSRPQIDDSCYDSAVAAVPAPRNCEWCIDPAASSDRMRLFGIPGSGVPKGEICAVYPDGTWRADSPDPAQWWHFGATGQELDLQAGMRRALKVAIALGWNL